MLVHLSNLNLGRMAVRLCCSLLIISVSALFLTRSVECQVEQPDRKHLFNEDTREAKKKRERAVSQIIKSDTKPSDDLNFDAPSVEFDKESNTVKGNGGVIISRAGTQIQSDSAAVNMTTKDSELSGAVVFSGSGGSLASEHAKVNIDSETGTFEKATLALDDGDYEISANQVDKVSETRYKLFGSKMTTCHCGDANLPWSISGSKADLTQEGYAKISDARFEFFGVPILYSPYFALPLKFERQSGLLVPSFGVSNRNGFEFSQPIFAVIDDSSDLKITPFVATSTRMGSVFEYRQDVSVRHSIDSGLILSDESARNGELKGTNVAGYSDPTFDQSRFGILHKETWRTERGANVPSSVVADVHYVSDDLMPRELDLLDITDPSARFATSSVALRNQFGSYVSSELFGEYNQALIDNDDFTFQRLPELDVTGSRSFWVFGTNPYGLKLGTKAAGSVTEFSRTTGYDGMRADFVPTVSIPFHYKNYFQSSTSLALRSTAYNLQETAVPGGANELDNSSSRSIYQLSQSLSTAFERAYDVDPDSTISKLSSYGAESKGYQLSRVKHTIEPTLSYVYVPDRDQSDLPLFDSSDRIRRKNYVSYGFKSSLLGRFRPQNPGAAPIVELSPEIEDLPSLEADSSLPGFGESDSFGLVGGRSSFNRGEVREIANLYLRQIYDINQDIKDSDGELHSSSDINLGTGLFPTRYMAFTFDGNYSPNSSDFSSWGVAGHLRDDRGDALRARYTFVDQRVGQLEGAAEISLEERVNLAYYARYDERASEFMEQRFGLRFWNTCRCWHFDLAYHEKLNPDSRNVLFSVTFGGLGDLGQAVAVGSKKN